MAPTRITQNTHLVVAQLILTQLFVIMVNKNLSAGFTLVELLVVIAIIAILASVVIVSINPRENINKSKDSQAIANVNQISLSFEACITSRIAADRTEPEATDDCCGATEAGPCVSDATHGLSIYKYGSGGGFPIEMTVNRGAAGTTFICMSQKRGTDDIYVAYGVGDGTLTRNSPTGCYNGVAVQP